MITTLNAFTKAIVVHGASEKSAIQLYTAVASGQSVVALTDGDNEFYTHESLSGMYNPNTGDINLDPVEDNEFAVEASARAGTVDVFHAICSDGCGEHIVADVAIPFCPSCSTELPDDSDPDLSDEEDLVDLEDEDGEEVEYENLEAEASEGMIVVAGDNFDEALENFQAVAKSISQKVVTSGNSVFVTHASSDFNFDPLSGSDDIAEDYEAEVSLSSMSSDSSDSVEAEHYVCSDTDCGTHIISTSSSVLNCTRCGSGLLDPADFQSESSVFDDIDDEDEMAALAAEIEELEMELGISESSVDEDIDALFSESEDEMDDVEDEEISDLSEDDEDFSVDYSEAEGDDESDDEFESESSDDDLSEDLEPEEEPYDPEAEEDLSSEEILESESYALDSLSSELDEIEDDMESESSDDFDIDAMVSESEEDDLDIDEMVELSDMQSESADYIELDEDIAALLSESGDEESEEESDDFTIEDDEDEDSDSDDFDQDEEETDYENSADSDEDDVEGLEIESESHDMELEVDMLSAIAASEDLSVEKFHVAHCGSIEGSNTWTAFYGKLPVAMCSESNVADKPALKDIFDSAKFKAALMAHASAEGIESALSEFNFERINPQFDVNTVVEHELVQRSESRVQEVEQQMAAYAANVEAERDADMEHRMDRLMSALATSALGINRNTFANIRNPIADRLIAAMSASGLRNAEELVSDAFVEAGDDYNELLLGQARELLEKDETTQDEITRVIVATASNRVTKAGNDVESRLTTFPVVNSQVPLQSESSANAPQGKDRYLKLIKPKGQVDN